MKFINIILAVPVFSLSNIFSSKKCINCKHFMRPQENDRQVGKCSLFPILNDEDDEDDNHYLDCIRSRKNHYFCGEKGRYYEKSIPVEVIQFLTLVDPSFFDQYSEFDFEQYIQFL